MRGRRTRLILLLSAVLALGGCTSSPHVSYIPEGGSYGVGDLPVALMESDPGSVVRLSTAEAADARQEALSDLRVNGADAAALADVLTSDFPTDIAAVPYAVELGTFDGERAWIVYEAWGDEGEDLTFRRLWVYSYNEPSLLAAQSQR